MSDEQKYLFDLKGWICLPGLLSEDQLEAIRAHQLAFLHDRESLPPQERDNHGGPSEILLDHPAVVGVLNEILSHQGLASESCYGFRYDHTYTSHRTAGNDNYNPHGGGGLFNFEGNSHIYQMQPGKIHAGLTRVVWELNEVGPGDGGTLLLSGSHKTAFPRPDALSGRDSDLWETYACPAGSALIFTEALGHTGTKWVNEERDRLSLFTCYNTVNSKWGKGLSRAGGDRRHEAETADLVPRRLARDERRPGNQQVLRSGEHGRVTLPVTLSGHAGCGTQAA